MTEHTVYLPSEELKRKIEEFESDMQKTQGRPSTIQERWLFMHEILKVDGVIKNDGSLATYDFDDKELETSETSVEITNTLEKVQDELVKRGFPRSRAKNLQMLPAIIEICTNTDIFTQEVQAKKNLDEIVNRTNMVKNRLHKYLQGENILNCWERKEYEKRLAILEQRERDFDTAFKDSYRKQEAELEQKQKELNDYIDKLTECETAEARDKVRMLKIYKDSVDVDTKYDNTAYIAGVGAILAGNTTPTNTLKTINKKIP